MSIDIGKFIVIDNHAHLLLQDFLQLDTLAFRQCFSESYSIAQLQDHLPTSVFYLNMLHVLGDYLGLQGEEAILEFRTRQSAADYLNLLWDEVCLGALIVDDGFVTRDMQGLAQMAALSARPVYQCRRIESVLEESLTKSSSFHELSKIFSTAMIKAGAAKLVAFKTINAYRGGLHLDRISSNEAAADFENWKAQLKTKNAIRLERSALYQYFLWQAFEIAGSAGLPVQIHCGIGDNDADLLQANPALLHPVLKSQHLSKTNFVLLHCFPYVHEAAYLCAIYPNVFMDLSLSVSLVNPGVDQMIMDALSQAPTSKILAGSDGHSIPETHWYGARCWKNSLQKALQYLYATSVVTEEEAYDIAARILHENARALYHLEDLV